MKLKTVPVAASVGHALAHDLTRIVPGKVKETAFKKGQVVRESDLETLLDMGRQHLYVMTLEPGDVHENDAAASLAEIISGPGVEISEATEGKVSLRAKQAGLLKVGVKGVARINAINHLAVSTLHTNTPCPAGELVAAAKVIPLVAPQKNLDRARAVGQKYGPLVSVKPFLPLKVGAVITGAEIMSGRVKDGFDQFVATRITAYGAGIMAKIQVGDDAQAIARAIKSHVQAGAEMVVVTGGLSIDPDDVTRKGVRRAGAKQVFYGTPVLPGAMFLYAKLGEIPVLGLPACVFYNHRTVFDLVLPRILAGESLTRTDINALGHGGLCKLCDTCTYPHCPFGKGGA